jgi:protein-S-isoprenylcysteine O-methyltransferase
MAINSIMRLPWVTRQLLKDTIMTSIQLFWLILGVSWVVVEIAVAHKTRAYFVTTCQLEYRSERLIWMVVIIALFAALWVKQMHWAALPIELFYCQLIAIVLFVTGLALRCYAVVSLGRHFSTTVMTKDQHILIESGPYRLIRHPAYTGLLSSFLAVGLAMGDGLALLTLMSPVAYVLTQRIRIEEQWLSDYFDKKYGDYSLRTKKLLPWIY